MIQAITNLTSDIGYGYEVEIIDTRIYTHEFLDMIFKDNEFQANDIYSMLVRDDSNIQLEHRSAKTYINKLGLKACIVCNSRLFINGLCLACEG